MLRTLAATVILSAAPLASPTPIPKAAVDQLAATFTTAQLQLAFRAIYIQSNQHPPVMIPKPAPAMPADDPLVHYVGLQPDGSIAIWI